MHRTLFQSGTVLVELTKTEKFEALHELIKNAAVFNDIIDKDQFERMVIAREKIQSTGLGRGVAFAHGKLPEIKTVKVALGISRRGIDFASLDGLPVHLLFLVATNPGMHIDYLKCLATLACMARLEGFREEIISCHEEEVIQSKLSTTYARFARAAS